MHSVEVAFLSSDPQRPGVVVFLKSDDGERLLPIQIGLAEASAIHMKMEGFEPPRPMTHDLMMNIVEALGGGIESASVHSIRDGVFYGAISIRRDGGTIEVDSRPSDAIPLALRAGVPIYVHESVMEEAGIPESRIHALLEESDEEAGEDADEDFIRI